MMRATCLVGLIGANIMKSLTPALQEDALAAAGHELKVGLPWSEGRISACAQQRDAKGRRMLLAAANPRGMQGYAVGR